MSQRRTLILIAAIAVGALASFLVWNYVGGIQDQAYSDAERVKVYLVKEAIPRGTPGTTAAASIAEESIPRKFKPANAIESLDDIAGQVAKSDLVANQVVVQDMFVEADDPSAQVSFAENLTKIRNEDQATYTMTVNENSGVAGLIVPGDYVNVMYVPASAGAGEASSDSAGDGGSGEAGGPAPMSLGSFNFTQARYVYQKVQVLAVDSMTVGSANQAAATGEEEAAPATEIRTGLITLIVPPVAAQTLASFPPGNLYLSLVGPDYEPVPQETIDLTEAPAEDAARLTPYGPEGARKSD